jgi:subtilisin family serine protease
MKKSERQTTSSGEEPARDRVAAPPPPVAVGPMGDGGGLTGRYIVLLREDGADRAASMLHDRTGLRVATTHAEGTAAAEDVSEGDALVFSEIGAAVLTMDPDQLQSLQVAAAGEAAEAPLIEAIEPERYVFALAELGKRTAVEPTGVPFTPESDASRLADALEETAPAEELEPEPVEDAIAHYLRGYRDSTNTLVEHLLARTASQGTGVAPALLTWNESANTWGLQATRVTTSPRTGRGIRVAVLDTGFGPHPDFAGRTIRLASFVSGQAPADGHGHGTHCIGTACGPRTPRRSPRPRYGVAHESEIFAGKVLSNSGSGTDASILAGINWAVANGCRVVSMSLGAPVAPGAPFSAVYEGVAQRALQRGTLIIAAAGNNRPNPVNHPANCPSIMAVAAVDDQLRPASFSARGTNPNGGAVDIAAPGVNVYSSWPLAPMYRRLNGTSMATPHVAGIAALLAQATGLTGAALWRRLVQDARPLAFPRADVGAGLAQAR